MTCTTALVFHFKLLIIYHNQGVSWLATLSFPYHYHNICLQRKIQNSAIPVPPNKKSLSGIGFISSLSLSQFSLHRAHSLEKYKRNKFSFFSWQANPTVWRQPREMSHKKFIHPFCFFIFPFEPVRRRASCVAPELHFLLN